MEKCYCGLAAACCEHVPPRRAEMSSDAIAQKPLVFYDEYDRGVAHGWATFLGTSFGRATGSLSCS
jgi:hypothetical protein